MTEKCHFIGIGGIGMSGLARILLDRKKEVTGSDLNASPITDTLEKKGAKVSLGHTISNISPSMTVVFSTDIKQDNPEFKAAVKLRCEMFHRAELLQKLMEGQKTLAVTGTHGKTTTSSLLSWVLYQAGLDPSFAVGGVLPQFQSNGKHGEGDFFVAEADESDGSFLKFHPYAAIVTNIGREHMPHFQTEERLLGEFRTFMSQVENPDLLFWCGDDSRLQSLAYPGITYGFGEQCQLRATQFTQTGWSTTFTISYEGKEYRDVEVALTGRHQVLNSLAVFGLAFQLGLSENQIREGLRTFGGVGRRCEKLGEEQGVLFLDDYAHHTHEIGLTLQAIKKAEPSRRIVAVFQPHRYTRTRDCLGTFAKAFEAADHLIITDIYTAREKPIEGVTPQKVLEEIKDIPTQYVPRENLPHEIASIVRPLDLVVTLGAGDITKVGRETLEVLKKKSLDPGV